MSTLTLALDASTYSGSVALLEDERVVAARDVVMRGEREERLMPAVAEVLSAVGRRPADVGRIVCGAGPGSFTSLRIAASIAKGLALASGAHLHAVSSLRLIVAGDDRTRGGGRWLASLDAMRGDRFAQLFEVGEDDRIQAVGGTMLVRADELHELEGSLAARRIGPGEELDATPRAAGVARLLSRGDGIEQVSLDGWEPEYGRLAEAQVRWEAAHGRPLPRS